MDYKETKRLVEEAQRCSSVTAHSGDAPSPRVLLSLKILSCSCSPSRRLISILLAHSGLSVAEF